MAPPPACMLRGVVTCEAAGLPCATTERERERAAAKDANSGAGEAATTHAHPSTPYRPAGKSYPSATSSSLLIAHGSARQHLLARHGSIQQTVHTIQAQLYWWDPHACVDLPRAMLARNCIGTGQVIE
ncbi:hypothetical protein PAHAL_6G073400 [Panicum hallii]|uniref:Uncharacterized protein n=1 Tax=Panicum hallii TaxID=206008 RepID=A0A2S3I140_9POAL|nr:hypothetical protein PAHAL_6G073400 [Panicum hallii]